MAHMDTIIEMRNSLFYSSAATHCSALWSSRMCSAVHAAYPLCSQLLTRTRGLTWIYSWANASTDENWRVMTNGMERPRQHWQEGRSIHPNCVHFPLWHMYFWNSSNRRCGSKRTASGWDAILVPVKRSPVEQWGKIRRHVRIKWSNNEVRRNTVNVNAEHRCQTWRWSVVDHATKNEWKKAFSH